jgi:hypothetical protein
MSQLHKLFKELIKLSAEDQSFLWDALREKKNCERTCEELGVKYSDKRFAKYLYERNKSNSTGLVTTIPASSRKGPTLKQIEQIVCGDNLDIIEEAARKKGLI